MEVVTEPQGVVPRPRSVKRSPAHFALLKHKIRPRHEPLRSRASQCANGDIQLSSHRDAVEAFLVAVGYRASCRADDGSDMVHKILSTGGDCERLRQELQEIWRGSDIDALVSAFQSVLHLEELQLSWASLYAVLEELVQVAKIEHYFAVGTHRLHSAVKTLTEVPLPACIA